MKTRLIHNLVRMALLLLPLLALLFTAQLGFASPAQQNGKGDKANSPAAPTPYALFGNATNTGAGTTVFKGTGDTAFGAWQFKSTDPNGSVMSAMCEGLPKCRGIYVYAGAVGIDASSAYSSGGTDSNNPSYGVEGTTSGYGPYAIGVYGHGYGVGGQQVGVKGKSISDTGIGVWAESGGTGVRAESSGSNSFAVYATASSSTAAGAVYAQTQHGNGVYGTTYASASDFLHIAGVQGNISNPSGIDPAKHSGVYGHCLTCAGVTGETQSYIGVRGLATTFNSAAYGGYFSATAGIGVYGESSSNYGVYGRSTSKYGVYGKSDSSYAVLGISGTGYGVYGKSNDSIGVYAKTETGNIALRAVQPNAGASNYAGYFDGNVQVNGNLTCSGGCVTAMGVATDKGEKLVYADASTGSNLSDQGTATLKDGRAIIKIDPLFAQTVSLGAGYQVFAMPGSFDSAGLAVGNQTATSFEVRELNGGKGNYTFHWRLTATRKGYETVRLAPAPDKAPATTDAVK